MSAMLYISQKNGRQFLFPSNFVQFRYVVTCQLGRNCSQFPLLVLDYYKKSDNPPINCWNVTPNWFWTYPFPFKSAFQIVPSQMHAATARFTHGFKLRSVLLSLITDKKSTAVAEQICFIASFLVAFSTQILKL